MKRDIVKRYIIFGGALLLLSVLLYVGNNSREKHKVTEFQRIIRSGTIKELTIFLAINNGTDFNKLLNKYCPYWNLFGTIADQNDLEKLQLILQYNLSPNLEDERNSFNLVFPLTESIKNPRAVKLLLESGACPNKAHIHYMKLPLYEEFPLLFAIRHLQTGKERSREFVFSNPDSFFPESLKELKFIRFEQINADDDAIMESIKLLVQYGADVNKGMLFYADRDKKHLLENETPLIVACKIGRLDLIRFLLDSGADTSLQHSGKAALDHCRESSQFDNKKNQEEAIRLLHRKKQVGGFNLEVQHLLH